MNSPLRLTAFGLLFVYAVAIVLPMVSESTRDFHDVDTYYYTGKAVAEGLNPYDPGVLQSVSDGKVKHRFVYPPQTLHVFRLFTLLPRETAYLVFLGAKLVALALLLVLWTRVFLEKFEIAFLVFCLFAFNSAIYIDLSVGNISIFEQLFIWTGIWQYTLGRYAGFVILVVAIAMFKITPILLVLLLLLRGFHRREVVWFAGSVGVFGAVMLASYFAQPDFYVNFFVNMKTVNFQGVLVPSTPRGVFNPTSLTIYQYTLDGLGRHWGIDFPASISAALYVVTFSSVIGFTASALQRLHENAHDDWRLPTFLFVTAYALVLPRLSDYGYILLLVPAYYAILHTSSKAFPWLLLLMSIQTLNIRLPGAIFAYNIVHAHFPLLMAYVTWGLLLQAALRVAKPRQEQTRRTDSATSPAH